MGIYTPGIGSRLVLAAALAVLLAIGIPAAASAHVLKVDGDISAVLHVNPDDNPVSGSPTKFIIWFSNDTNRFSLPQCNCTVSIIENGRIIANKELAVSSAEMSQNTYTFEQPAVYTLRFSGTPKQAGDFQPFVLNYEERVVSGQGNTTSLPTALWVGIGAGIGLILLAATATNMGSDEGKGKTH